MAKYLVKIEGMSCEHCVKSVSEALGALPGAKDLAVDLAGGSAKVDTGADKAAVKEAIEDIGFDVLSIEEQ